MSEDYVKILILVGLQRGQATLPDLFFVKALDSSNILAVNRSEATKSGGKPPFLTCSLSCSEQVRSNQKRGQATLPDLFFVLQ
jgi:hypothetical protein